MLYLPWWFYFFYNKWDKTVIYVIYVKSHGFKTIEKWKKVKKCKTIKYFFTSSYISYNFLEYSLYRHLDGWMFRKILFSFWFISKSRKSQGYNVLFLITGDNNIWCVFFIFLPLQIVSFIIIKLSFSIILKRTQNSRFSRYISK